MSNSTSAEALRAHLFATIQAVRDGSMAPDAAEAISAVAKQIIDIDKTAIMYMDKIGGSVTLGLIDDPVTKPKETVQAAPRLGFAR